MRRILRRIGKYYTSAYFAKLGLSGWTPRRRRTWRTRPSARPWSSRQAGEASELTKRKTSEEGGKPETNEKALDLC